MPPLASGIALTEVEKQLFSALLGARSAAGLRTTLRCAGGWVRDKLLGRDSLDIDVALDNCSGQEFAERVNEYLAAAGQDTRSVAVIQANPDQSKHLETARMKVHGHWVDLVNLRSETYAADSRIPTMEFGTPKQDALRRDFTINALFYNINTGDVEDFTGRGIEDLRAGLIRTPLPPLETFLDDPLRVLRAVRFAARFGFEMDAALVEAAAADMVRDALQHKVSRERIGTEVDGMFKGPAPLQSVQYLDRFRLFPVVFALPADVLARVAGDYGQCCLATMAAAAEVLEAWQPREPLGPEERRLCLLAALLLPLRLANVLVKGKPVGAAGMVVRDGLKWKAKDAESTSLLHCVAPQMLAVHDQLQGLGTSSADLASAPEDARVALGLAVRKAGKLWRAAAVCASVLTAPEAAPLGVEDKAVQEEGDNVGSSPSVRVVGLESEEALQRRVECCSTLEAAAYAFGVADAYTWKPLMDGKQIMAATGAKGPRIGQLTAAVIRWQLAHPGGSQEECAAWLRDNHGSVLAA